MQALAHQLTDSCSCVCPGSAWWAKVGRCRVLEAYPGHVPHDLDLLRGELCQNLLLQLLLLLLQPLLLLQLDLMLVHLLQPHALQVLSLHEPVQLSKRDHTA